MTDTKKFVEGLRALSRALISSDADMRLPEGSIDPDEAADALERLSAEDQEFRLQNDREWKAKVDYQKTRAEAAEAENATLRAQLDEARRVVEPLRAWSRSAITIEDFRAARTFLDKTAAHADSGGEAERQYYYRVPGCTATAARDPDCICWHDEGTGPLASCEYAPTSWRTKPTSPASTPVTDALPELPDDDSDFTPELAREIIAKYQEYIATLSASTPAVTGEAANRTFGEPEIVRLDLDSDGNRHWYFASREGFEEIGDDGVLKLDMQHFEIGTRITLEEPLTAAPARKDGGARVAPASAETKDECTNVEWAALGAWECLETTNEWFARREAGEKTKNSEEAVFERVHYAACQLQAVLEASHAAATPAVGALETVFRDIFFCKLSYDTRATVRAAILLARKGADNG